MIITNLIMIIIVSLKMCLNNLVIQMSGNYLFHISRIRNHFFLELINPLRRSGFKFNFLFQSGFYYFERGFPLQNKYSLI